MSRSKGSLPLARGASGNVPRERHPFGTLLLALVVALALMCMGCADSQADKTPTSDQEVTSTSSGDSASDSAGGQTSSSSADGSDAEESADSGAAPASEPTAAPEPLSARSAQLYGQLLSDLSNAYEAPGMGYDEAVQADLEALREESEADYELAQALRDHWYETFLSPTYQPAVYSGGQLATELEGSGIPTDDSHAFVVLGYELENGQMTAELCGRCEAAAAAARSYPNAILVCSGGATGKNNPERHTEAGLMRDYLRDVCGIDEARIHIDDKARDTTQNAQNTFRILREEGVHSMTIVTSSYHQPWGEAVYHAESLLCERDYGHDVRMVGSYSFYAYPAEEVFWMGNRFAVHQIAELLGLPQEVIDTLPYVPEDPDDQLEQEADATAETAVGQEADATAAG